MPSIAATDSTAMTANTTNTAPSPNTIADQAGERGRHDVAGMIEGLVAAELMGKTLLQHQSQA